MFNVGMKTSVSKQPSADTGFSGTNPFDSDSESGTKPITAKASPNPSHITTNPRNSLFNEDEETKGHSSSSSYPGFSAAKTRYKNDFRDSGGFENQSVQVLQNYAVYKAEETTQSVNSCLKIAEDIREDATRTLVTLHEQGEQITRTHLVAADMDQDLSRSEKLLGSLGGIFSRTWKPKKTPPIKGPALVRDYFFERKTGHLEQRERAGLFFTSPEQKSNHQLKNSEPSSILEKVEVEKAKQDDTLSEISNILGQLKDMAVDMGSEIDSQNKALEPLQDDVDTLNIRVKGASQRGRRLLGK